MCILFKISGCPVYDSFYGGDKQDDHQAECHQNAGQAVKIFHIGKSSFGMGMVLIHIKEKARLRSLLTDLQSPTFKLRLYKSLRAAYVIKKTHKLPILYHVIGELSMLKLYEKSHIKHLPGYGRVWYGFCLNV